MHRGNISSVAGLPQQPCRLGEIVRMVLINRVHGPEVIGGEGIVKLQPGFEPLLRGGPVLWNCNAEVVEEAEIRSGGPIACLKGLIEEPQCLLIVLLDTDSAQIGDRQVNLGLGKTGSSGELIPM